jgi:hypothetical protein
MVTLGRNVDGAWIKEISGAMDKFVSCWIRRVNPGDHVEIHPRGGMVVTKGSFSEISNKFVHAVEFLPRLSGSDPTLDIKYADAEEWTTKVYDEVWLPPLHEADATGKTFERFRFIKGGDMLPPGALKTPNGYYVREVAPFWDYLARRSGDEAAANHVLSVPITIVCVIATLIDTAMDNWPLKCLATYIDTFGGVEPFLPSRDRNKLDKIRVDTVAAIRITMLLQAALYWDQYTLPNERSAMVAYIQYVFKDPNFNNASFRKQTGVHRQSVGAGCSSGKFPMYNGATLKQDEVSYVGYVIGDVGKDTQVEATYLARVRDVLKKESEWCRENMPGIIPLLHDVIYGELDVCIRSVMLLSVLGGLPGFTRGNTVLSHFKNINIDLEQLKKDGYDPDAEYPATNYLYGEALNYSSRGALIASQRPGAQGSWLSWDQFRTQVLRALTTNSAGIAAYPIKYTQRIGGKLVEKEVLLNDKISVFYLLGTKLFEPEMLNALYTRDDPGTIGQRRVPGAKPDRAIYVVRITDALLQRIFFTLYNGQMERDTEFTLGRQTGTAFIDQFSLLFATTRDSLMIWGLDFSGFDVHQDAKIAAPIRQGLADGARELTGSWGPFVDLSHAIEHILSEGKVQKTVFRSGKGEFPVDFSTEDPDQVEWATKYLGIYLQLVDILLSGRGDTLHRNNVVNRGVTNYMTDQLNKLLPEIMQRVMILRREFQGDDSTQVWHVSKDLTPDEVDSIVDVQTKAAAANRQELNRVKTVARKRFFEFLKVSGLIGKPIPLLFVQPLAAEKVNNLEEPAKLLAGYRNKLGTLVSRGFDEEIAQRLMMYTWAFRRSLKIFSLTGEGGFIYPPFEALYVPESNHGVGMVPWCMGFSNNTMPIMSLITRDPVAEERLNYAAWIMSVRDPDTKKNVANEVVDSGVFDNGQAYVKSLQPNGRLRAAQMARLRLTENGIRVPNELDYSHQAESLAKLSLESTTALRSIDLTAKTKKANAMKVRMMRIGSIPDQFRDFAWMRTVTFYNGPPVKPVLPEAAFPHAYLHPFHAYLLRVTDLVSAEHIGGLRINRLTQILNSDPHFMGRVADEQMAKLLTNNRLIANPAVMADYLTAIGAGSDTVRKLISEVYGSAAQNAILHKDVIGLSASVTAMASYSRETQQRIISTPVLAQVYQSSYDILLRDFTLTVAISEYYRTGTFKFIESRFTSAEMFDTFNKMMLGKNYEPEMFIEYELLFANYRRN